MKLTRDDEGARGILVGGECQKLSTSDRICARKRANRQLTIHQAILAPAADVNRPNPLMKRSFRLCARAHSQAVSIARKDEMNNVTKSFCETHWSCHSTWICEFLLRSEWQYKNRASFVTASTVEPANKSVLAALVRLFRVATGGV